MLLAKRSRTVEVETALLIPDIFIKHRKASSFSGKEPSSFRQHTLGVFLIYTFMCSSFLIIKFITIADSFLPQITLYVYEASQLHLPVIGFCQSSTSRAYEWTTIYLIIDIYVERASIVRARSSGVGALGRGFSFFSSFSDLLPGRRALRLDIVDVLRMDAVSVMLPVLSCVVSDGDIVLF